MVCRRPAAEQSREAAAPAPRDAAFIAERALLSGLVGLFPVPFADDLLLSRARRTLLRDVGRRAKVELDAEVLDRLTAAAKAPRLAPAGGWILGRVLRRVALPLRLFDRGREALVTFQRATLLAHHLRHGGTSLSPDEAAVLLARMDSAAARASLYSLRHLEEHAVALRAAFDSTP